MALQSVVRGLGVGLLLALLGAHPSFADEKEAATYAGAIGKQALAILDSKADAATKQKELQALFVKLVDIDWIARFVIGVEWRKMKLEQQQDYLQIYRQFLIKHYTSNFEQYAANTTFKVIKSRPIGGKDQYLVGVKVLKKGEPPVNLEYRVRQQGSDFKAIDIIVEGVSLLATQRSEFASVIQRDGVQHLIALLKKKAA